MKGGELNNDEKYRIAGVPGEMAGYVTEVQVCLPVEPDPGADSGKHSGYL